MRTIGAAIAGATTGAVLVALGEAAVVALERALGVDPGLLFFALLFYGLAGAAIGLGLGVALALLGALRGRPLEPAVSYGLAGAVALAALATVIGRFRVFRDVLNESFDGAPISPLVFQLGSLAIALALLIGGYLALATLARRQRLAASGVLVLAALAVALGATRLGLAVGVGERTAAPARAPTAAAPSERPPVILIMVDTLRADHLSAYGYQAIATPAIDALAADGTRFAHAYAQASWTRPSVATILTSLYPSSHQAVHKSDVLPDEVVTLPEVLHAAGYRTAGFPNNINVAPLFNFQQGFDEYVFLEPAFFFGATEAAAQLTIYNQLRLIRERYLSHVKHVENYYQPGEVVTERGLDWIARHGDQPFFLFLHYMDPHDPYFRHPYDGEAFARVANPNPDGALADRYRAAYDGEIVYLDEQLGRLFAELKARGLYERSLIVFTSDHGEEFHEHGGWWHGLTLYEEQIAVPLIVKPPAGGARGVTNTGLVSTLDIMPTVLALAGVSVPDALQGRALGLGPDSAAPRDHAFAEQDLEGNVLQAYRNAEWKLIEANPGNPRGLPETELFAIARDRGERENLAGTEPEEVANLSADLAAVQSHAEAVAVTGSETHIDAATEERLRALGYVH